jgi:hypothetical protein
LSLIIPSVFFRLHSSEANPCSNESMDDLTKANPYNDECDRSRVGLEFMDLEFSSVVLESI